MFKTIEESVYFVQKLASEVADVGPLVYLGVPFTAIRPASEAAKETNIVIGAQNMNDAGEGAFTGEIAAGMLLNAGAKFVLIGHSERRHVFGETDEFINRKMQRASEEGLQPILCIGETLQQREAKEMKDVLTRQLTEGLKGIEKGKLEDLVIAYEPVWAIGTGVTATPKQAQGAHKFCREVLEGLLGKKRAGLIPILYGGSVKPSNAKEIIDQKDIDGVLVGGASLTVESFSQIVNYQSNKAGVL